MTIDKLRSKTKQDLAQIAKRKQVEGWHSMTKDQLAKALARLAKKVRNKKATTAKSSSAKATTTKVAKTKNAAKAVARTTKPPKSKGPASSITKKRDKSAPALTAARETATKKQTSLAEVLRAKSKDELERIAKKIGVTRWHSLRKEELVRALSRLSKSAADPSPKPSANGEHLKSGDRIKAAVQRRQHNGKKKVDRDRSAESGDQTGPRQGRARAKYHGGVARRAKGRRNRRPKSQANDRIVAMVRDAYWLHVYWELSAASLERTEAALGQDWYTAQPILRLLDVSADDSTSAAERILRDIEIHGGVNNWYIELSDPPGSYRVDIGYKTARGRFFALARSNSVHTPKPGASDQIDQNWVGVRKDCERIYALSGGADPTTHSEEVRRLFEDRLRRPMSSGSLSEYGSGALAEDRHRGFNFTLDAELIVYGKTDPHARVTLLGEPVQLRSDGSFTMRFSLPDGRQILPAVAETCDGIEVRTVILAVERNTKELEPLINDGQE